MELYVNTHNAVILAAVLMNAHGCKGQIALALSGLLRNVILLMNAGFHAV
jgi:hypothetical protein